MVTSDFVRTMLRNVSVMMQFIDLLKIFMNKKLTTTIFEKETNRNGIC